MRARKSLLTVLRHGALPIAGVAAVVLAIIEVFVDWITWIELNEALLFTLPLVLAAMARNRRLLWSLTLVLTVATFAVYSVQIRPEDFSFREPFFVNRVLVAATILLTSGLLQAWMLAQDKLEEQDRNLNVQNGQLDEANRELVRCHAEITQQNAELDCRRREAEEANGRKTRLLASVSHDIRSPLAAISQTTEVLRLTADDPDLAVKVPGLARRLQNNARALSDLVADLLDLTAMESGRVELRESEIELNEVLEEECHRLLPLAEAKHLTLTARLTAPPVLIHADRIKLLRVLTNLVTNAIKFTKSGGVTLTAGLSTEGGVVISVRDTGVGIAADSLDHIFEEFTRVRAPGAGSTEGWGLGLAVCRRLVNLMGGEISVASELGDGSIFSVHLPATCVRHRTECELNLPSRERHAAPSRALRCT